MVHIQKTKLRIADNALFLQYYECTRIRDLPLIHLFNSWGSITYIYVTKKTFYFKEYKTIPKYFYDFSSDLFTLKAYVSEEILNRHSLKPNISAHPNPTSWGFKQFSRKLFSWQSMIVLLLLGKIV